MGLLVALTGLDGSGKTTQGKSLYEKCEREGICVCYIHLKEIDSKPYYNEAVNDTKELIKKERVKKSDEIRNIISANLFIAKVKDNVLPKLSAYDVIIMDRYRESAKCYHMLKWKLSSSILTVYNKIPAADVNFFLDTDIDECFRRLKERRQNTLYENYESLKKAQEFYSSISKEFTWIDSNRSVEEITKELFEIIKSRM